MEGKAVKRKLGTSIAHTSQKRVKSNAPNSEKRRAVGSKAKNTVSVDDLPWKAVPLQGVASFRDGAGGGMLMLEEVEGVEVIYGEGEGESSVVQFQVKEPQTVEVAGEDTGTGDTLQPPPLTSIPFNPFDPTLLPSWAPFPLHPALLQSIHHRGFECPTEIQKRTLDVFLNNRHPGSDAESGAWGGNTRDFEPRRRDIVGIAETGSGKTLAYGLPILHSLLSALSTSASAPFTITPPFSARRRSLQALVLAPTRELALQVSQHLNSCLDQIFAAQTQNEERQKPRPPPPVSVAAIVGGMSAEKQHRVLSRGTDILVATPGRLWDLCSLDAALAAQLRSLRFLVLDEADRMIQAGHFQELDNILRITSRPSLDTGSSAEQDPQRPEDLAYADAEVQERNDTLQTFVFSATMSKELQQDLKRRKRKKKGGEGTALDDLLMRLDFRDPDPVIIDLSPKGGRVEGLQESKVECLTNDKDVYLYYFLLRHPGRSLVFLSSIDGIRRLMPLLELLRLSVWPLHSGLQQRQRLKNLDRFKSTSNSVLVATDVAARGLDVPAVDHVIHYQVPRSADAYVHRNGRTARAKRNGFGLVLCAPNERRVFRGVLAGLERGEEDVPDLSVEHHLVDKLKARIQLAREIDGLAHRAKKDVHERNWMREAAEEMELEVPSELESDSSDGGKSRKRSEAAKVKMLRARLKITLEQPLVARGVSLRYITSGSRRIVDDVLEGESHETLLGLRRVEAGSEIVRSKKRKAKKTQKQGKEG